MLQKIKIVSICLFLLIAGCSDSSNTSSNTEGELDTAAPGSGMSEQQSNENTADDGASTGDGTSTDGTTTSDNAINPNSPPVPLDTIRADVLNELAGYQSESLAEGMYALAATVENATNAVPLSGNVINTELVSFDDPATRNSFDCPLGGTLIRESISTNESFGGGVGEINEYDLYQFDQCVTTINGGSLADGNYELNGSYIYETFLRFASSGSSRTIAATWNGFNYRQVDVESIEFDGTLRLSTVATPGTIQSTRDSQIIRYGISNDGTTIVELANVDFFQQRSPIQFPDRVEGTRQVRINGEYTGPLSQGETLQVSTDPELTESISSFAEFNEPLAGSLQITSTDGGVLTMTANGPLTVSFLSADGTTSESILEELPVFDLRGYGCVPGGGEINEMLINDCSF